MEAEKDSPQVETIDQTVETKESVYISPEVAAAMRGETVEMGKHIIVEE